ncbi:MAG: hypothetical protein EBV34_14735, partial [Betaproteobacteria bacterium]|nr:hypothetical protein [Betaproteobacteria bacterium]
MTHLIRLAVKAWFFVAVGVALFACGGGDGDVVQQPPPPVAKRTLTVVPALGGFGAGATVTLLDPTGAVIGTATTDANGSASPEIGGYSGPLVVRVSGAPTVSFFNEKTGTQDAFGATARLLAVVPGIPSTGTAPQVGVTPLTNAAAAVVVPNPDAPTVTGASQQAIRDSIALANAKVQIAVGLDPSFNILAAPRALRSTTDTLSTTDPIALRYGVILTALALASPSNDLLAAALNLAADAKANNGALPQSAAILNAAVNLLSSVTQRFVPAAQQTALTSFIASVKPDPSLTSAASQAAIAAAVANYISAATSSSSSSSSVASSSSSAASSSLSSSSASSSSA